MSLRLFPDTGNSNCRQAGVLNVAKQPHLTLESTHRSNKAKPMVHSTTHHAYPLTLDPKPGFTSPVCPNVDANPNDDGNPIQRRAGPM
jgi:hypothetical protein